MQKILVRKHSHSIDYANQMGWGPANSSLDSTKKSILDSYLVGKKIADIGCASGKYTHYIHSQNYNVIGIDHDPRFLVQAKKNYPEINVIRADASYLPLKNKSIDTLVAFDILEHVPEEQSINDLIRVTRKRLILSVPKTTDTNLSRHYLLFGHHADVTHLRTYTSTSLRKLAKLYKFKNINIFPSHPISAVSIYLELFHGPNLLKRLMRKITLLFLRPNKYYTNLIMIADLPD